MIAEGNKGENPQPENGTTAIAHEIVEALCQTNLSPYESRVLWCIFRKTYGWHKKEDWIALPQMVEMTGMSKAHVCRAKAKLLRRNIVAQSGNKIRINKFYTQWRELPERATGGNEPLPVQATEEDAEPEPKVADPLPEQAIDKATAPALPEQAIPLPKQATPLPEQAPTNTSYTNTTTTNPSSPSGNGTSELVPAPKAAIKKPLPNQMFTYEDDARLIAGLRKTLALTMLPDGKGKDNYARRVLCALLKLFEEQGAERSSAAAKVMLHIDSFYAVVLRARDKDEFLRRRLVTMRNIYSELSAIFETAKEKPFASLVVAL